MQIVIRYCCVKVTAVFPCSSFTHVVHLTTLYNQKCVTWGSIPLLRRFWGSIPSDFLKKINFSLCELHTGHQKFVRMVTKLILTSHWVWRICEMTISRLWKMTKLVKIWRVLSHRAHILHNFARNISTLLEIVVLWKTSGIPLSYVTFPLSVHDVNCSDWMNEKFVDLLRHVWGSIPWRNQGSIPTNKV